MPVAPATSAVRAIAPRFCGSVTSSSATSNGSGARSNSAASAYGYGSTSAATPWCASEPARSSISSALTIDTFAAATRSASVAQIRCTFRLPRSASRTGLRP